MSKHWSGGYAKWAKQINFEPESALSKLKYRNGCAVHSKPIYNFNCLRDCFNWISGYALEWIGNSAHRADIIIII